MRMHFVCRLLEVGHTIAVTYELYRTTIILYGAPNVETISHPALGAVIILGAYIATLTQVRYPPSGSTKNALINTTRSDFFLLSPVHNPTYAASPSRTHNGARLGRALRARYLRGRRGDHCYFVR